VRGRISSGALLSRGVCARICARACAQKAQQSGMWDEDAAAHPDVGNPSDTQGWPTKTLSRERGFYLRVTKLPDR